MKLYECKSLSNDEMRSVVCGPKSIISLSCYTPTMHYYSIIKKWFSLNHNLNRIF